MEGYSRDAQASSGPHDESRETGLRSMTYSNIVELSHVTVYRGDTRVLADLSLTIPAGCHTAILGPSGAGKSTLLKLLSCELHPVSREGSSLRLFGQEGLNVWDLRKHLGVVSHDLQHQYLEHVRGEDVILSGYGASIGTYECQIFDATQRERAGQVMRDLGVIHLKERLFGRMSAGEQRRFLLGRALIRNPAALVLDEPTSGLDLQACFHYLDLVRNLMRQGKTLILVTHHIHEIPPEISRVVLLKEGRIVADGPKREIFSNKTLSALFDTAVELVQVNGFYQVLPGKAP